MPPERLTRRQFLRLGALTVGTAALAGCAPRPQAAPAQAPTKAPAPTAEVVPTTAPAAPPATTLQYWCAWSGTYVESVWPELKKTPEYAKLLGNNQVEVKGGVTSEALLTAVAGGTPPDIASNLPYLDFMARGVLAPLDNFVTQSTEIKKENFLPMFWKDGAYKGVQYGIPANDGFLRYGLNYNATMVEEAGLDPDKPPVTWTDTLEWHRKLTKFDSAGNLKQIGLDPYDAMGGSIHTANGFMPVASWNWTWFDEATGKFDLDNEKMAEAFDVLGEFIRIVGPDKMAGMRQVEGQGIWGGSYNSQVQAMIIDGYWRPGMTSIQKPEVGKHNRTSWLPVPDGRSGAKPQGTGGHYCVLFKDSKTQADAFKVAEFLNTKVSYDTIFKAVGWLPGTTTYHQSLDASAYPGLKFYIDSSSEATEWSSPARCEITAYIDTQFAELREKVFRNQMTAKDAAAEMQRRAEAEYKAGGFVS